MTAKHFLDGAGWLASPAPSSVNAGGETKGKRWAKSGTTGDKSPWLANPTALAFGCLTYMSGFISRRSPVGYRYRLSGLNSQTAALTVFPPRGLVPWPLRYAG